MSKLLTYVFKCRSYVKQSVSCVYIIYKLSDKIFAYLSRRKFVSKLIFGIIFFKEMSISGSMPNYVVIDYYYGLN